MDFLVFTFNVYDTAWLTENNIWRAYFATVISKCCDMKCYFWRVGKMYLMEIRKSWLASVYFCKQKNQHPAVTQNGHAFKYVNITLPSCLLAAGMRSSSLLITCLSYEFLYILIISVVQLRHFPFRWLQYKGNPSRMYSTFCPMMG